MQKSRLVKIPAQPFHILDPLRNRPPIAKPRKLILRVKQRHVKVLKPHPFQRSDRMDRAPGPQRRDAAPLPLLGRGARRRRLIPTPTLGAEDRALEEHVAVVREVLDDTAFWLDGPDVLGGELAQDLPDVKVDGFDDDEKVTVAEPGVGADRLEEVREPIRTHRQVGLGSCLVAILEVGHCGR